jgi:hypothetical protein
MTLVQSFLDFWRIRLEELNARLAGAKPYDSFRLEIERRVLTFLLRRHGGDHAPVREAEPLSPADHQRSESLFFSPEARERLSEFVTVTESPPVVESPIEEAPDAATYNKLSDAEWFRGILNAGIRTDLERGYLLAPVTVPLCRTERGVVALLAAFVATALVLVIVKLIGL